MYQALQGNLGLSKAIDYFTSQGIVVSIPLNDTQAYDLVADIDNKLMRISVKTGRSSQTGGKTFNIQLRNTGGGRKTGVRQVPFDKTKCDYLFIYTIDNKLYLIPTESLTVTNSITVGTQDTVKYEVYIKSFTEFIKDYK